MKKAVANLPASVRQRLLNLATERKEDFGLVLTADFGRFVFERNSGGRVLGFRVFTQAARGIEFSKVH